MTLMSRAVVRCSRDNTSAGNRCACSAHAVRRDAPLSAQPLVWGPSVPGRLTCHRRPVFSRARGFSGWRRPECTPDHADPCGCPSLTWLSPRAHAPHVHPPALQAPQHMGLVLHFLLRISIPDSAPFGDPYPQTRHAVRCPTPLLTLGYSLKSSPSPPL